MNAKELFKKEWSEVSIDQIAFDGHDMVEFAEKYHEAKSQEGDLLGVRFSSKHPFPKLYCNECGEICYHAWIIPIGAFLIGAFTSCVIIGLLL